MKNTKSRLFWLLLLFSLFTRGMEPELLLLPVARGWC